MSYMPYRSLRTGTQTKSIFVALSQNGSYRQFEAVGVPIDAVDNEYIALNYAENQMWRAGVAMPASQAVPILFEPESAFIQAYRTRFTQRTAHFKQAMRAIK